MVDQWDSLLLGLPTAYSTMVFPFRRPLSQEIVIKFRRPEERKVILEKPGSWELNVAMQCWDKHGQRQRGNVASGYVVRQLQLWKMAL